MSTDKRLHDVTVFLRKVQDSRSYADAQTLADWLNLSRKSLAQHQQRAKRAIGILREINLRANKGESWRGLSIELSRFLKPLNHLRWRLVKNERGQWHLNQTYTSDADYGLFLLARLSERGLDWLRECEWCARWFLAYTRRSRFCSGKCKISSESARRKTPRGREARAIYMRRHRALLKLLKRKHQSGNAPVLITPTRP